MSRFLLKLSTHYLLTVGDKLKLFCNHCGRYLGIMRDGDIDKPIVWMCRQCFTDLAGNNVKEIKKPSR